MKTIIQENNELLKSLSKRTLTGDEARLAHRLAETTRRLETAVTTLRIQSNTVDSADIYKIEKGLIGR